MRADAATAALRAPPATVEPARAAVSRLPASTATATPDALVEGLRIDAATVAAYRPDNGDVLVTVSADIRNVKAGFTSGGTVTSYYFTAVPIAVPTGATDLAVRAGATSAVPNPPSDGGDDRFQIYLIELDQTLFYLESTHVEITYRLPAGSARSEELFRIGVGHATFWLLPYGDPGAADVEIRLPASFDADVESGDVAGTVRLEAGDRVHRFDDLSDPLGTVLFVTGQDRAALARADVDAGGTRFAVASWPGDPQWSEFVTAQLRAGYPILEELVGIDAATASSPSSVVVVESMSPYLFGYAGWYQPADDTIVVGEQLDSQVLFHELGHLWFNDGLFSERWITEGLANSYAAEVRRRLGETLEAPDPPDAAHPGAQPLNAWGPVSKLGDLRAQEEYGYDASWWVSDQLIDEVGFDVMADVLRSADAEVFAYLGDRPPEHQGERATWRRFLDLVDERSGTEAGVELFADHVVGEADQDQLRRRGEARARYGGLQERAGDWAMPYGLRARMDGWRFDEAATWMDDVEGVLDRRDAVVELAGRLDVGLPAGAESAFESGYSDLDPVMELLVDQEQVLRDLQGARERIDADRSWLTRLGAWGLDTEADYASAVAAFGDGELDQARADAAVAADVPDRAAARGRTRAWTAAGVAVGLIAAAGALAGLRTRRRRRHRPDTPGGTDGAAVDAGTDAPEADEPARS